MSKGQYPHVMFDALSPQPRYDSREYPERRFELVKTALDQDLRYRGIHYNREEVATRVVALADAVVAEMERVDDQKEAKAAQRHFATQDAIADKKPEGEQPDAN